MKKLFCLLAVVLTCQLQAQDQQLFFGATTNLPGATLTFENGSNYITASGYCFGTMSGTDYDPYLNYDPNYYPYAGYYYNRVQSFSALAAANSGAAALGTVIQMRLLHVNGPAGSSFAFWDGNSDGTFGTNLTWSVPVPFSGGTNQILITQAPNSATNDPYGYFAGRVFGFIKPGLYKLTWQLIDTSTNGPGRTPLNQPSAPFSVYYQADNTIASITCENDGVHLTFAAPSGLTQPNNPTIQYGLEQSPSVGEAANWTPVLDDQGQAIIISGDDYLHTNTVPQTNSSQFYRLNVNSFTGGT